MSILHILERHARLQGYKHRMDLKNGTSIVSAEFHAGSINWPYVGAEISEAKKVHQADKDEFFEDYGTHHMDESFFQARFGIKQSEALKVSDHYEVLVEVYGADPRNFYHKVNGRLIPKISEKLAARINCAVESLPKGWNHKAIQDVIADLNSKDSLFDKSFAAERIGELRGLYQTKPTGVFTKGGKMFSLVAFLNVLGKNHPLYGVLKAFHKKYQELESYLTSVLKRLAQAEKDRDLAQAEVIKYKQKVSSLQTQFIANGKIPSHMLGAAYRK